MADPSPEFPSCAYRTNRCDVTVDKCRNKGLCFCRLFVFKVQTHSFLNFYHTILDWFNPTIWVTCFENIELCQNYISVSWNPDLCKTVCFSTKIARIGLNLLTTKCSNMPKKAWIATSTGPPHCHMWNSNPRPYWWLSRVR